ncbi:MAG: tyrosine-type recombinase/integrase [Endomicrobium sp.]|nr:tyrosine-type recombinase/integrase [Endomicrobium sp.]
MEIKNVYLKDFTKYLKAERNYSIYTIKAYSRDIIDFINFLKIDNRFYKVTKYEIRNFLKHLNKNKNLSKSSIIRKFASLRTFFRFLMINNVISKNPIEDVVVKFRKNIKVPIFLTELEISKLLSVNNIKFRDKAIIELLYSCGLRVGELVNLDIGNVNFILNTIHILGKGNKTRIVPIGKYCIKALSNYIFERKVLNLPHSTSDPLFLNSHFNRMNQRTIRKILDSIIHKSGIKKRISPHTIRHTFATHLIDRGCDLRTVQEILGHKNLVTTQIYTHVTISTLRKIYDKSHPFIKTKKTTLKEI